MVRTSKSLILVNNHSILCATQLDNYKQLLLVGNVKFINKDIYKAYIDFKNAIGSIDHAQLLFIVMDLGYPQDAINLIGNICSNSSTSFQGKFFTKTPPIQIENFGIIQGDTLSPYLFIIFLEFLL